MKIRNKEIDHMKHFALPKIKKTQQNRYSNKIKTINRSLPKIQSFVLNPSLNNLGLQNSKASSKQKIFHKNVIRRQKIKKQNYKLQKSNQTQRQYSELECANVTNNFRKQILKNLKIIKHQKQLHKKNTIINKSRYITPTRNQNQQQSTSFSMPQNKCVTQEDVFSKINKIITQKHHKIDQYLSQKSLQSISSNIIINDINTQKHMNKLMKKIMKTQGNPIQRKPSIQLRVKQHVYIKNNENYQQWRKLSIQSPDKAIDYQSTSFQKQTQRLQKIRSKNELSLKKYFQGKQYLTNLLRCCDSSLIQQRKQ